MKLNLKKGSALILCIVVALAVVGTVYAAGYLMTSPESSTLNVEPKPDTPATLSKIALSVTTITEGDTVILETHVSDKMTGILIMFYDQYDSLVGQTYTNTDGIATIQITPPAGAWTYHATGMHP